jgi:hypothetical protein
MAKEAEFNREQEKETEAGAFLSSRREDGNAARQLADARKCDFNDRGCDGHSGFFWRLFLPH